MTEKKKVNVTIDSRNFTVVGDSSEEYVKGLALYVDRKIKEMSSKNDRLSSSMAATLAAFNITDELYKSNEELESLKTEAKDPMENYDSLLNQLNKEKEENQELQRKCDEYKDELIEARRQNELLSKEKDNQKNALDMKEKELQQSQNLIKKLQDKIYENQVELVQTKKELEEVLKSYDKEKNIFSKEEV